MKPSGLTGVLSRRANERADREGAKESFAGWPMVRAYHPVGRTCLVVEADMGVGAGEAKNEWTRAKRVRAMIVRESATRRGRQDRLAGLPYSSKGREIG